MQTEENMYCRVKYLKRSNASNSNLDLMEAMTQTVVYTLITEFE